MEDSEHCAFYVLPLSQTWCAYSEAVSQPRRCRRWVVLAGLSLPHDAKPPALHEHLTFRALSDLTTCLRHAHVAQSIQRRRVSAAERCRVCQPLRSLLQGRLRGGGIARVRAERVQSHAPVVQQTCATA